MKYAVAIDVGGTNTRVALVNEWLEITDRFIREQVLLCFPEKLQQVNIQYRHFR